MARSRDESKKKRILLVSKSLFASRGFFNTSISDIVRETELPVGTIYTYFKCKSDIILAIIHEGWTEFYGGLEAIASSDIAGAEKLRLFVEEILPGLFRDRELINILLTEAVAYTHIEEKIEKITDLVSRILREIPETSVSLRKDSRKIVKTAIVVFFLGVLNATNLSRTVDIGAGPEESIELLKHIIAVSLGIEM